MHLGRTDCDSQGRSPLALAVKQNKREMVEHLITIGAPTKSQDNNGDTIYHYCLEMGDEGIALLQVRLINQGPEIVWSSF